MRFLLWFAFGLMVIWLLRGKNRDTNADTGRGQKSGSSVGGKRDGEAEAMRQCVNCSVHFPASEAVLNATGEVFCCGSCCDAHRGKHR